MVLTAPIRQTKYPTQANATPDTVSVSSVLTPVTASITGSVTVSGTVTVSSITNTVSVTGTVSVSGASFTGTVTISSNVTVSSIVAALPTGTNTIGAFSTLGQSASFTTGQVTITASATQIFAVNASTIFREVTNPTTTTLYLGTAGVTTGNGHILPGPAAFDMQFNSAALYGIVTTGSVTVSTIGW